MSSSPWGGALGEGDVDVAAPIVPYGSCTHLRMPPGGSAYTASGENEAIDPAVGPRIGRFPRLPAGIGIA
jgi:hypothetical protein